LFNIKTGEWLSLNASLEQLSFVMLQLLHGKFHRDKYKTDDEFVNEIKDCVQNLLI